jgi:hypothetical protein
MFEEIKSIYRSSDYDKFIFMKGNRPVNKKKVTRMIKELKEYISKGIMPFLLIRVTPSKKFKGKYEISDGQHEYLVLKSLGLDINFYIVENETIDQIRFLNSNMNNWSIWDYVISYHNTGNDEYIKLVNLKERYNHFEHTELFVNLALKRYTSMRGGPKDNIKNGSFKFDNYDEALIILDRLTDFKIIECTKYTNYTFIRAMLYIINCSKYDHKRMMTQFRKYPRIAKMMDIDSYIEEILHKYNWRQLNSENKIHFHEVKG